MERYHHFRTFHDISLEDYQLLTGNLKQASFKKGDNIIVPGQIQQKLYFIKSGVQMACFESVKKTHVLAFTYYPNMLAIPGSFTKQAPSAYFFKSLTNSELEYITFSELQDLFDRSRQIERFFRKMTEEALAGVLNRHIELHAMTMEERYKAFCRRSPDLLRVVPHKYIASYLGIDPTNFSKLFNNTKF